MQGDTPAALGLQAHTCQAQQIVRPASQAWCLLTQSFSKHIC